MYYFNGTGILVIDNLSSYIIHLILLSSMKNLFIFMDDFPHNKRGKVLEFVINLESQRLDTYLINFINQCCNYSEANQSV